MPVLYLGRNVNHISRVQFLSGFAPLLIITPSSGTKQNLTAFMVNVPVITATRLKSHIPDCYPFCGKHIQVTLPNEIPNILFKISY